MKNNIKAELITICGVDVLTIPTNQKVTLLSLFNHELLNVSLLTGLNGSLLIISYDKSNYDKLLHLKKLINEN